MTKKPTPLKDEQEYNVDELYQKLDELNKAIQMLVDQKNADSEQQNITSEDDKAVTTENFSACFRKGCQVLQNEYAVERRGLLFDKDLEDIGVKFKEKYGEFTKDLVERGKENDKAERKRLDVVFDAHEIRTMEQMEGWASEYSEPVRRWMRWLGKNIFDDDEPKETVQEALRVIGDCMMASGFRPKAEPESEPTFRAVLLYKWRKVKPWLAKRKMWCYYLIFIMGLAALLCLGIYHNRVMQMDKTNRIFYKTVIQTRRDAEIWQDIDSIVKGIKLQHESYADPPKKE